MKGQQRRYNMSVAATILLGLASSAAAQTSSFKDPMTGEPIQLISRGDMRRKMQDICPEAIDTAGESWYHPTQESDVGALW
eukprot:scaffold33336_cov143-Skeletonema_menzelii.AAC.2